MNYANEYLHKPIALAEILRVFYEYVRNKKITLSFDVSQEIELVVENKSEKELSKFITTSKLFGYHVTELQINDETVYIILMSNSMIVTAHNITLDKVKILSYNDNIININIGYILKNYNTNITKIRINNLISAGIDLSHFIEETSVRKLVINNSNLSKVKTLKRAFANSGLEHLEITNTTLDSLTDMSSAFMGIHNKLKTVILPETPKLENIQYMFTGVSFENDEVINNLKWITSNNLRYVNSAFKLSNIQYIDLRHLNLEKIISTSYMFDQCERLQEVQFGGTVTPELKETAYMFNECSNIKYIDLGNITSDKLLNSDLEEIKTTQCCHNRTRRMFTGVPNKCNISIRQELIDIIKKNNTKIR